jgi:hypothetical protein
VASVYQGLFATRGKILGTRLKAVKLINLTGLFCFIINNIKGMKFVIKWSFCQRGISNLDFKDECKR